MNDALRQMLSDYRLSKFEDFENALKEILQDIALLGLWRSKFFEHAAFYGGTALRILYQLDRFSEDMDFSLLKPDNQFKLDDYLKALKREIESFGFSISVEIRGKKPESTIESAFLKGGTIKNLITIEAPESIIKRPASNQKVRIKLEVDTDPPPGFDTETKYIFRPIPFSVNSYALPDLFAGKMHAVLCRGWKMRTKGRDWYDFVWFVSRNIPLHLEHLRERMTQSGHLAGSETLNHEIFKQKLLKKIESVNFEEAKSDALPFLKDPDSISSWSTDFFSVVLDKISFL